MENGEVITLEEKTSNVYWKKSRKFQRKKKVIAVSVIV
jgi:hypothetical protein